MLCALPACPAIFFMSSSSVFAVASNSHAIPISLYRSIKQSRQPSASSSGWHCSIDSAAARMLNSKISEDGKYEA